MEATLEGAADVRVRDVEIALVLAREMKAAADRSVDASLRLEQLQEVFGADSLDSAERARIQTALQMAGLDPRPSLLEADPAQPIRFAVGGDAAGAPAEAPAAEPPAEQRQEFPTVGEFARTAFRRFRGRRPREAGGIDVTTAVEQPPAAEQPPAPVSPEPEPLMEDLAEEPLVEEPADEIEEPPESPNGHVDVAANGHSHLDFEDVAAPPQETATPADFGAAAELEEPEEYELEPDPELEHVLYAEPEPAAYEPEPDAAEYEPVPLPEPEPVAEPEPIAYAEPGPPPQEHAVTAPTTGIAEIATVLLPVAAIPVVIASFAGLTFGLPFVALAVIATGLLASRHGGGLVSTLRSSGAARSILYATALITVVAIGIALVLSGIGGGSDKPAATKAPPAKPTAPPKQATASTKRHAPKKAHKPAAKKRRVPADKPDEDTKGLILVPPRQSAPSGTATTPGPSGATPTTPQQPQQPAAQQGTGR